MSEPGDVVIGAIQKTAREELRVMLQTFRGHHLVSLRVWSDNNDGAVVPTRSGLNVRVALLDNVIDLLMLARTAAVARGILPPAPLADGAAQGRLVIAERE